MQVATRLIQAMVTVAADAQGNIYGAEVDPKQLMRYVKQ